MLTITQPTKLESLNTDDIRKVQQILTELDYDSGPIDGVFGNKTLYAFNRFKEDFALSEPDWIGPTTIKILSMARNGELEKKEDEKPHPHQPILEKPQITYGVYNWFDFKSGISKYFTMGEVTQFDKDRIIIEPVHRQNAIKLAKELDKIREDWGKPIGVTSWYRPPAVNRRVGGARYSTHLTGSAADIYPIGGDIWAFQKWLDSRWNKALGYGAKKGFVHIDMRSQPKRIRWNY